MFYKLLEWLTWFFNFQGRGGLGSIYVFSAGNGGVEDSCAFDGYVNSIYTISITGITSSGTIPRFGENCAGIMAVTYARDWEEFDKSKVVCQQHSNFQTTYYCIISLINGGKITL